jgi:hypothetical protein
MAAIAVVCGAAIMGASAPSSRAVVRARVVSTID